MPPYRKPPLRPIQPRESFADLLFPVQGLDISQGFGQQRPRTTVLGQNVRAYEPGTARARGGQRPGILTYISGTVAGNFNIQEINAITDPTGTGGAASGGTIPAIWTRGTEDFTTQISESHLNNGSSNVFTYGAGGLTGSSIASVGFAYITLTGSTVASQVWQIVSTFPGKFVNAQLIPGPQILLYAASVAADATKFYVLTAYQKNQYITRLVPATGAADYSVTNAIGQDVTLGNTNVSGFTVVSGGVAYMALSTGFVLAVNTTAGAPSSPFVLLTPTLVNQAAPGYVMTGQTVTPPGIAVIGSTLAFAIWNPTTLQGGVGFVNTGTGVLGPAALTALAPTFQTASLTSDGTNFYVLFGNSANSTVVKITAATGAVVWTSTLGVPGQPGVITYVANTGILYVSNGLNSLSIDPATGNVIGGGLGIGLLGMFDGGTVTPPAPSPPGQDTVFGRNIILYAVSNGTIKVAKNGVWNAVTNGTAAFSGAVRVVRSAVNGGKAYFLDANSYKLYDPSTNSILSWTASQGSLPRDASNNYARLIATWRGRTVLAGLAADGQNWFMSAVNDPTNWNYFPTFTTPTQAVAGNNAPLGLLGDAITALIPYTDDLLVMGGDHTVWMMRGDPMAGGQIDLISDSIGIAWGIAWCRDPYGNLYFVSSRMGIYTLVPGNQPQRISQQIEQILAAINIDDTIIRMAWDDAFQGIHVFITHISNPRPETHLFYELRTGAWWTTVLASINYNPFCCYSYFGANPSDRVCLIGSWDGHVRAWQPQAANDEGLSIQSFVLLGPILSQDLDDILVKDLQAVMGTNSNSVTYSVLVGDTAEQALASTPVATGTWSGGRNRLSLVRRSGYAHWIKIAGTGPWSMESIRARIEGQGKVRRRAIQI